MAEKVEIMPVPPNHLEGLWEPAYKMLEKAIARNDGFLPEDVFNAIMRGNMTLWLAVVDNVVKGAMVTQIVTYPRKRTVFLLFMGGEEMKEWLTEMEREIVNYANAIGAQDIESLARKGFGAYFFPERTGIEYFTRRLS